MEFTIKELEHKDAELIVKYWYSLTDLELLKFGADKTKFLKPTNLSYFNKPYIIKKAKYLIENSVF